MTECEGKNDPSSNSNEDYCPFIEILSFGSDINIKCNNSYLIFNEINNDTLNWKFANQTSICSQNGTQQAYIGQCGISRFGSNYLKARLKSSQYNEYACIYCQVNYKPIAALITVTQSDDGECILYTFNITATGLEHNESFEILWAKRANDEILQSFNYWFSQKCVNSIVKSLKNTGHTIIFIVDDVSINRVEFIIRRCNGKCRNYDTCHKDELYEDIISNRLQIPDSIEKLSCDSDCLNYIFPETNTESRITSSPTTETSLSAERIIEIIIVVIISGLLLLIVLIIFILCIVYKMKKERHIYSKTSNVNPDESSSTRIYNKMENQLRSSSKSNAISSSSLSSGNHRSRYYSLGHNDNISLTSPSNNCTGASASATTPNTLCMLVNGRRIQQRYKLLTDGVVQVCRVPHAKNIIEKIRFSRFLRRWEDHHINLEHSEITSITNENYMDRSIAYSAIEDISVWSKSKVIDSDCRFCIRIVTNDCIYFFQVNTLHLRDQWFYSIQWKRNKLKFERILRSANRPEVLLKEMMNMIDFAMTTPIEDVEVHHFPLEIISEILQQQEFNLPRFVHENVIVALAPLLEKNYPSPEICDFFSRHCRDSPRSQIVIEMFTPVVQRILKHNTDFGKYPRMRIFVQEYLLALNSQNDGLRVVQDFIKRIHGPTMICPFPRVLSNFVSVCLAAIYNFFDDRKNFRFEDKESCRAYEEEAESQLVCYTKMLQTMSTFDDWRPHLGLLLQSVPFPDEALTHDRFIEIFKNVVKNFVEDTRCEVHQTVLGIREGKEGWFEMFCLGSIACDDDGEMFSLMLSKLISCCCRKKRFLLSINKLLPALMLLALRESQSSLDTLCAMLDLDAVENRDNKLQLISTLQSTPTGLKMYAKVCERQIALRELQQKGGPRKLTLPSRSTDNDLAKLLSSGSFGNLECLSLAFTNVTSACAEHLIKLPALRYLNLWSTQFGDAGLELISEHLNRLQVLNLCETPVTDKGLAHLACMKMLRKLNLNSTHLSPLTFEALKEKLPALQECDIRYTDAW